MLPHIRCDGIDICNAADTREQSTANAPFQRHQPGHPPDKNFNSVAVAELPARHFSGLYAQIANVLYFELS